MFRLWDVSVHRLLPVSDGKNAVMILKSKRRKFLLLVLLHENFVLVTVRAKSLQGAAHKPVHLVKLLT
jgi:hypothetical protein